jgi:replicative DNA helicase
MNPTPEESARPALRLVEGSERQESIPRWIDLEAEGCVLSLIMAVQQLDQVRDFLTPEHFYSGAHRRIYEAACSVADDAVKVDNVTVGSKLRETGRLAEVGGMAYLTQVLNAAPYVGNIRAYARTIQECWALRQLSAYCQKHKALAEGGTKSAEEALGEARADIENVITAIAKSEKVGDISDVMARVVTTLEQARRSDGRGELPTGFDRYDRVTLGLHTELAIVAGRPGMGKTSLVTQIGMNIAARREEGDEQFRNGVLIVSLETTDIPLGMRMLAAQAKVDVRRMRAGMMTPSDWSSVMGVMSWIGTVPFRIDDESAQTVATVWAKARRFKLELEAKGKKLKLVAVDYLQLLKAARKGMSREEVVSENTRALVAMANDLNCCVIGLAQLNRECERRDNKRPLLSDLRESGEMEQAARTITFVYRDEYYDKDSEDGGIAELIVAKQNTGPTDTIRVRFDGAWLRFDNLPDGAEDYEGI